MVVCLSAIDLAWTPTAEVGIWRQTLDLLSRSATGAIVYALALTALWLAAGRPDGAERYLARVTGKLCHKLGARGVSRW